MRGLAIFLCFLLSCALPQNKPVCDLIGTQFDYHAPPPVPASEYPELDEYVIRTRIVIEIMVWRPENIDGVCTLYAGTSDQIYAELKYCEEIFKDLNIKFEVTQFVFVKYDMDYWQFFNDAKKYPDTLSIYYMLPHIFPYQGMSSGPWEDAAWGILLSGYRGEHTLAHEIGHYFGLLHTFSEDYCDDTPEQENKTCEEDPNQFPNCCNIMNYCVHEPKYITKDQIERCRRFLRKHRQSHIMPNHAQEQLEYEKLYNEILRLSSILYEPPTTQPTNETSNSN